MTGLNGQRVYLDWNATAPLRPEARAAMLAAMDVVGNPSSVHAEGRAAKAIVEKARGQVAALVGCDPDEVVFTSGATEAVNQFVGANWDGVIFSETEHDCVVKACEANFSETSRVSIGKDQWVSAGGLEGPRLVDEKFSDTTPLDDLIFGKRRLLCVHVASGETGVVRYPRPKEQSAPPRGMSVLADVTQAIGRTKLLEDIAPAYFDAASLSAHKIGGPKGVGALCIMSRESDPVTFIHGGGQEKGRRSGTENVIGIAGFGAAAEAARRDLDNGVWEPIENLRDSLEQRVAEAAPDTIFFGKDAPRLPNTSCFAVPGWAGEMQVMQMDLAGFAISAGSACSSGKVKKASRVLLAMGFDEVTASSAIRVSMGATTTEAEVMAFADNWIAAYQRMKARAA